MFEVTGLIDLTVSFVQPQTPGGVDAYSYRLPTASKGCGGWENFEEGDRLVEVDGVGERREDGAERSGRYVVKLTPTWPAVNPHLRQSRYSIQF